VDFNATHVVDPNLQSTWNTINSFTSDGRRLLKTTMMDNKEVITWHTRIENTTT
jgi:hypothetical protein